jgi:hypothetical protein
MSTPRLSIVLWHSAFNVQRRLRRVEIEQKLGGYRAFDRAGVNYSVSADPVGWGCWPSWRKAALVSLRDPAATHHLILGDDMLPCRGFLAAVTGVIAAAPDHWINLFSMRGSQAEARAAGLHWVVSAEGLWGGSYIVPTERLGAFLEWERQVCDPKQKNLADYRASLYVQLMGQRVWQTAPSLVQHIEPSGSLVGHNNARRVAGWFVDDGSVADIDWTLPERPVRDTSGMGIGTLWAKLAFVQLPRPAAAPIDAGEPYGRD